jgi:sporulation protein YlmC with PRC-barrel domain
MRAAHFRPLVRDLRQLHKSAQVLQKLGKEDACETVIAAMQDLADNPPKNVALRRVSDIGGKLRVDELMDAEVRSADNEYLGSIDDMVLDSTGQPSYVIVEYGGFLGFGEDQVVIPFESLQVSADRDAFFVPVTEAQFEEAPRFKRDGFDWAQDETWRSQVDGYFITSAGKVE